MDSKGELRKRGGPAQPEPASGGMWGWFTATSPEQTAEKKDTEAVPVSIIERHEREKAVREKATRLYADASPHLSALVQERASTRIDTVLYAAQGEFLQDKYDPNRMASAVLAVQKQNEKVPKDHGGAKLWMEKNRAPLLALYNFALLSLKLGDSIWREQRRDGVSLPRDVWLWRRFEVLYVDHNAVPAVVVARRGSQTVTLTWKGLYTSVIKSMDEVILIPDNLPINGGAVSLPVRINQSLAQIELLAAALELPVNTHLVEY